MPPQPSPPPSPNPNQDSIPDHDNPGPFWNAWVRLTGGKKQERVLSVGETYTFSFDLSRIQYGVSAKTARGIVRKLREPGRESVELVVRPTLIDTVFSLSETPNPRVEVKLAKLAAHVNDARHKAIIEGKEKLDLDFAEAVRAGKYEIKLTPMEEGCATVGFSVWDAAGLMPLDHLVFTIYVGDPSFKPLDCGEGTGNGPFRTGLDTLLGFADAWAGQDRGISGALFIFEEPDGKHKRTLAVYVDPLGKTVKCQDQVEKGVYAWKISTDVEQTISVYLPDKIKEARKAASGSYKEGSYFNVARFLADWLFPSNCQAKAAFDAMKEAVKIAAAPPAAPPVFLVRVSHRGESSAYLPLGLLAASAPTGANSADSLLDKRITVVQPLPRLRYFGKSKTCVNTWTIGVPDKLEGGDSELPREIDQPRVTWMSERLSNYDKLRAYFAEPKVPTAPAPAEGLLLLAHQDEGRIWYEKHQSVSPVEITKAFPPGSVAVLAACVAASPVGHNSRFADTLNKQNFDAIVMSPFAVPTLVAERFTTEFAGAIRKARKEKSRARLVELFDNATKATVTYIARNHEKSSISSDMPLEFVIAGEYNMALCLDDER